MLFSATDRLQADMNAATSYEEWQEAAIRHDAASNVDKWKESDVSKHFDYASIRKRLEKLRRLRSKGDCAGLLFALNEGVHGNIDGMGHPRLYGKAKFGTKRLIVDYVDEVSAALELLADECADDIPFDQRLDFFRRARHCFGCSALMMSGAGSLLFFHIGVAKTLWQYGVLPAILSGSSGGAIVGGIISTNLEQDLEKIFKPENLVYEIERDQGILSRLSAFRPEVARAEEVREALERFIPDVTFLEALQTTGRHLNISIAAAEKHQTSRLLNAITTPNVYVREAVMASAAVPGFFPPVRLAAKNDAGKRQAYLPSRRWVDGSLSDDIPAKRLARVYGDRGLDDGLGDARDGARMDQCLCVAYGEAAVAQPDRQPPHQRGTGHHQPGLRRRHQHPAGEAALQPAAPAGAPLSRRDRRSHHDGRARDLAEDRKDPNPDEDRPQARRDPCQDRPRRHANQQQRHKTHRLGRPPGRLTGNMFYSAEWNFSF